MDKYSYLGNAELDVIDNLYTQYLADPDSVEESWKKFFEGFEFAKSTYWKETHGDYLFDKEFRIINLIQSYRQRGHLFTKTNPVRERRKYKPNLDIENFGLEQQDLETVFQAGKEIGIGPASLKQIVEHLKETYCRTIGVEYKFIRHPDRVAWLQEKMEKNRNIPDFSKEEKKQIYFHLTMAVGFEKFIHKKFVGQKRFSLEGAESIIPALMAIIDKGTDLGIVEFVIGMSHRGRLNVLANILQKPFENIFEEYNGLEYEDENILGDVKYHLGYENDIVSSKGNKAHVVLVPNPSHLETVGSVVEGITKAKIKQKYNSPKEIAPVLIHGDAAIASQGIVYEIIQMSKLPGYSTGGTIHIVINNQIGFTTNYLDARSSTYCTDIGKVVKAPIFHVNADDPEALVYAIQIAVEYRQIFSSDVFIDLLGYRKYGHNEGDEPRFTQPLLYEIINKHPNVRDIYSNQLCEQGIYSNDQVIEIEKDFDQILESKLELSEKIDTVHLDKFLDNEWKDYSPPDIEDFFAKVDTSVKKDLLKNLATSINKLPEGRKFFRKMEKLLDTRLQMIKENKLDWALCELLAYGSLVVEKHPVRISGQDSIRGTFSHRHAAYIEEDTGDRYFPLKHLSPDQASFDIFNSPLSEYGVMGFEYGYALATPGGLTIWEAQFGDFYNVAQVIVDQYISSAFEKWRLMNGLVLLLPHGYEGQGPEHSSARIERFLLLCANNNMQIMNCTTPASFFHAIRKQVLCNFKVPMIVFTPKSLLRHPDCVSGFEDLSNANFQPVIEEPISEKDSITRMVFTSGKIYYDLYKRRKELDNTNVIIIRIEQLYPFPGDSIREIISRYKNVKDYLWVQEEPFNMGAWPYIQRMFTFIELTAVARPEASSPAGGLFKQHEVRTKKLLDKVFSSCVCDRVNDICKMQCSKNI